MGVESRGYDQRWGPQWMVMVFLALVVNRVHDARATAITSSAQLATASLITDAGNTTSSPASCAAGSGPLAGSSSCEACAPGSFSTGGSASCGPCAAGSYAPFSGSSTCRSCAEGTFSTTGDSQCTVCPSGTVANSEHTGCTVCSAGRYSVAGDAQCKLCPKGSFNEQAGRPGCIECGPGRFNRLEGSISPLDCTPCIDGHMCPDALTAYPILCDDTHYAATGAMECTRCPMMFRSNHHRTKCLPTAPFYIVCGSVLALIAIIMCCVVQCPKKKWSAFENPPGVL